MDNISPTRCGFVAVMGAPNAGKSTLTNQLVGCKVSIVTHKAQTTRRRVLGIVQHHSSQIVLIDTPGIFKPTKALDRAMVKSAVQGLLEADAGIILVDVSYHNALGNVQILMEGLPKKTPPLILVLNKIDLVPKESLLKIADELNQKYKFENTFMISALKGHGMEDLLSYLSAQMPEGPWHYPEDQASNLSERQLTAEIVREKLFLHLHEELPYHLTVDTEEWKELPDGSVRLSMIIYVDRDSHKPIVLGERGQKIKTIGKIARVDISEILGRPVHLFLFVKVKEKWTERPEIYAELGLEFGE